MNYQKTNRENKVLSVKYNEAHTRIIEKEVITYTMGRELKAIVRYPNWGDD